MKKSPSKSESVSKKLQRNEGRFCVCIVSHSAQKGGAERALLELIDLLVSSDIFVHVILPRKGIIEDDLILRGVSYDITPLPWWANAGDFFADSQRRIDDSVIALAAIIMRISPNVVYTSTSVTPQGAIAAKLMGVAHIWNIAEYGRKEHGLNYTLDLPTRTKFIYDHSAAVIFVSQALRDYYCDQEGVGGSSYVFSPMLEEPHVEISESYGTISFKDDVLKLISIGDLVPGKGHMDAILSVERVLKTTKKVQLFIVGGCDETQYIDALHAVVKERNLEAYVSFVGYVDDARLLIRKADILLNCSIFEAFGRVTLEAMYERKPVIGSRSGATVDLIDDGVTGFLYEPGNDEELAEKIVYFLEDSQKLQSYGEAALLKARHIFSQSDHGELVSLFRSVAYEDHVIDSVDVINFAHEKAVAKTQRMLDLESRVKRMEASHFWKLRNFYLNFKERFFSS